MGGPPGGPVGGPLGGPPGGPVWGLLRDLLSPMLLLSIVSSTSGSLSIVSNSSTEVSISASAVPSSIEVEVGERSSILSKAFPNMPSAASFSASSRAFSADVFLVATTPHFLTHRARLKYALSHGELLPAWCSGLS